MPITSSSVSYWPQLGGRVRVEELHLTASGRRLLRTYLALTGYVADLVASAAQLTAEARDAEILENIASVTALGRFAVIRLEDSTAAQNASALREAYRDMTRSEAIFAGDYLNSLTDTQLRNAFGLTLAQVGTLRTNKLAPAASLADSIRAVTGA